MTEKKNIFICYLLLFVEILILFNSKLVIDNIIYNTKLFITVIFPSLFPTMIISLLLIKLNIIKIIPNFIYKIFNKLFNFNKIHTVIFLSSMLCASPTSSLIINEYLQKNLINEKEAENLLCVTHFINPLFIINVIGIGIFDDIKIGIFIILLQYTSNAIKAFILKKNFKTKNNIISFENKNILDIFYSTITSSIYSFLNIFSIVILFNILIILLTLLLNLTPFTNTLLNMLLEMSSSINSIKLLNTNNIIKFVLSYYSISFGGLSIIMQSIFMIKNKKIKYLKYFIFRLF